MNEKPKDYYRVLPPAYPMFASYPSGSQMKPMQNGSSDRF
jgi:hypothetical protein